MRLALSRARTRSRALPQKKQLQQQQQNNRRAFATERDTVREQDRMRHAVMHRMYIGPWDVGEHKLH